MQFPLSQRRHTNIAVVRYAKNGVKLEIACYKNKVISYRSGTETRLDEVLQVERIFTNVARGHLASEKEIATVFGDDMTEQQAIKFMLDHGELQVAQQERTAEVDEMFKDIATIISQKCVNTKTQLPFPSQVIEQALRSIGAGVKLDQPVKKQALGLIRSLIDADIIPIARANMKIRCITTSVEALDKMRAWCEKNGAEVVEKDPATAASGDKAGSNGHYSLLFIMQPSLFRDLDSFVKEELPVGSAIHMVDAAVTDIGDGEAVLDASAVSRANAHHGGSGDVGATAGPATATSASSAAGTRGHGRRGGGTSSAGRDSDLVSSVSNNVDGEVIGSGGGGSGRRANTRGGGGKGGKKGRHAQLSSDDSDEGTKEPLKERLRRRGGSHEGDTEAATDAKSAAAPVNDLSVELQKLQIEEDSDEDDEGHRKGKNKKNKKRGGAATSAAAAGGSKKGTPAPPLVDDDDDDDESGRKGKGKKNKKKRAAAAATTAAEKAEPEAEEAFSESDEELMVNRKQRAKKQHQQEAQQETNNWNDEEDYDYGEDEEGEQA